MVKEKGGRCGVCLLETSAKSPACVPGGNRRPAGRARDVPRPRRPLCRSISLSMQVRAVLALKEVTGGDKDNWTTYSNGLLHAQSDRHGGYSAITISRRATATATSTPKRTDELTLSHITSNLPHALSANCKPASR
jgi:hypothetical protein